MSSWIRSGTIVAAFLSTIGGVSALGGPGGPGDSARPGVLVELFTSQGCSTCPPADRLLTRLGAEGEGRIVPLAFHVDYWNHDGWSDPFSRHAWSVRQQAYVRRFRLPAEYTPQMVVDGSSQIIGSREADLRAAISAAAARPSARIALGVERSASRLLVAATVDRPAELRGRRLELMVAVFETGFVTKIGSGENGGKLLHDDYVVRSLERGAKIAADAPARTEHSLSLSADRGWDSSRLGVAAFLQDPKTLEVWGASSVPVPSGAPAPGAE
jgi:hypothetical protein